MLQLKPLLKKLTVFVLLFPAELLGQHMIGIGMGQGTDRVEHVEVVFHRATPLVIPFGPFDLKELFGTHIRVPKDTLNPYFESLRVISLSQNFEKLETLLTAEIRQHQSLRTRSGIREISYAELSYGPSWFIPGRSTSLFLGARLRAGSIAPQQEFIGTELNGRGQMFINQLWSTGIHFRGSRIYHQHLNALEYDANLSAIYSPNDRYDFSIYLSTDVNQSLAFGLGFFVEI